jgi:hypothetical protein
MTLQKQLARLFLALAVVLAIPAAPVVLLFAIGTMFISQNAHPGSLETLLSWASIFGTAAIMLGSFFLALRSYQAEKYGQSMALCLITITVSLMITAFYWFGIGQDQVQSFLYPTT